MSPSSPLGYVKDVRHHEPPGASLWRAIGQPRRVRGATRSHQDHRSRRPRESTGFSPSRARRSPLTIAMSDPTNIFALGRHPVHDGLQPCARGGQPDALLDCAIEKYYGPPKAAQWGSSQRALAQGRPWARPASPWTTWPRSASPRSTSTRCPTRYTTQRRNSRRSRDEIDLANLSISAGYSPVSKLVERPARRCAEAGGHRHPHRALREGIPGPTPHRRHLYNAMALPMKLRGSPHLALQEHGQARQRREAPAPGRAGSGSS